MPSSRARRLAARRDAVRRRRRAVAGACGAVLAVGATIAAWRWSDGDDGTTPPPRPAEVRDGSEALDRRGPIEIEDEPLSYRIAYRVETFAGGSGIVTRDEVSIRRPFQGRTIKRSGPEPDDPVRSEQIAVLGRLFVPKDANADPVLVEIGPSLAPSDVRIGPVLDDLLASGRVEAREWRRVAGRPCQVLRFGGPISAGTVAAVLDPAKEYADACVSEDGLVLEEVWTVVGRVQRRRLAISVDEGVPSASTFGIDADLEAIPVDEGGGSFRPVEPTSAYAAPFWVLDEPPLSTYEGRWAVVTPPGGDPKAEETRERRLGSVVDVWTDGPEVVVVEQGSSAGGVRPFELGDGPRAQVDGLGEGEFVLDLRTSELRFRRRGGYFIRVRGTLGRSELEDLARRLRETPGGSGLVYTDGR